MSNWKCSVYYVQIQLQRTLLHSDKPQWSPPKAKGQLASPHFTNLQLLHANSNFLWFPTSPCIPNFLHSLESIDNTPTLPVALNRSLISKIEQKRNPLALPSNLHGVPLDQTENPLPTTQNCSCKLQTQSTISVPSSFFLLPSSLSTSLSTYTPIFWFATNSAHHPRDNQWHAGTPPLPNAAPNRAWK